jgi:NADH:ubiquinone oxidoreductase 27 kD subunit
LIIFKKRLRFYNTVLKIFERQKGMAWISLEKAKKLEKRFGYPKVSEGKGVVSVEVPKDKFIEFLTFLKEDPEYQFKMFIDLTIIDHGEKEEPRFQGVVILFSPKNQERIIVKTWAENETLPTLTNLWKGAKWAEREAWDMFGIRFEGHENLVRMLLWETYPYHPLRKDFPLEGIKDTELPSLNETLRGENLEGLFNYDRMHTALPTMEDLEITQKKECR